MATEEERESQPPSEEEVATDAPPGAPDGNGPGGGDEAQEGGGEPQPEEQQGDSQAEGRRPRPRRKETLVFLRYGKMQHRGCFTTHLLDSRSGETFVMRTKRGTEWGVMVSFCDEEGKPPVHGKVLRRATGDDLLKAEELEGDVREEELSFCREKIREHGLAMKLVDVEHLLGSEKIIFYFTANGRVDFRALVKSLAQHFKTRIELKQIGVRDEAKVLGLAGHCGRPLCCRSYMRDIEQVTMKMAKIQKSTLDPSKISGACGRLMCCLRYEDEVYRELRRNSIPKGRRVMTEEGEVEVLDFHILSQKLLVQNVRGERTTIHLGDVLPPGTQPKKKEPDAPARPPREDRRRSGSGGAGDGDKEDGKPRKRRKKRRRSRSSKPRSEGGAPKEGSADKGRPGGERSRGGRSRGRRRGRRRDKPSSGPDKSQSPGPGQGPGRKPDSASP